jgi:hypothetical protein
LDVLETIGRMLEKRDMFVGASVSCGDLEVRPVISAGILATGAGRSAEIGFVRADLNPVALILKQGSEVKVYSLGQARNPSLWYNKPQTQDGDEVQC